MSSIPSSKMKHAQAHEGDHPEQAHGGEANAQGQQPSAPTPKSEKKEGKSTGAKLAERAKDLGERAQDLAEEAVDVVKARPKTAAAIGAAIVAGAAAIVAGPAAARALKGDDKEPGAKKKPAAKKPAPKKA